MQNNLRVDALGISTSFIVNYCTEAAVNLGYEDPNCITDKSVIDAETKSWMVNTKIISRYFDPVTYNGIDSMEFTNAASKNGLIGPVTGLIP